MCECNSAVVGIALLAQDCLGSLGTEVAQEDDQSVTAGCVDVSQGCQSVLLVLTVMGHS